MSFCVNFFENLLSVLSVLSGLKDQRRAFDRQLARFAREDVACQIVPSAFAVGSFTANAFVTAVDKRRSRQRNG